MAVSDPDSALRAADYAQRRALDPAASVWVSASAGTGKTKVLTDRVLALLLAGTEPERILCLTYTRAAAAEMAIRVEEALGTWAIAGADELDRDIERLTRKKPDDDTRARARALFGRVLDCPGGLKMQTIHAFCDSLLRRFPVEAGLQPHFQVLDELTARELLEAARDEVLARASGAPGDGGDAGLAEALARIAGRLNGEHFDELMKRLADERGQIARFLDAEGGLDAAVAALARRLDVEAGESEDDVIAAACADGAFDAAGLRAAAAHLLSGQKTDRDKGEKIAAWLGDAEQRAGGFDDYARAYLKAEGEPFKAAATKGLLDKLDDPDALVAAMARETQRVLDVMCHRRAVRTFRASVAALTLGAALITAYERRKAALARLDYDDLILRARALLADRDDSLWVLYKLDGGIDHVLVDEAQDTSRDQWDVIRGLTQDFFAGLGAREDDRTLFAVGDAKQSIYSFQHADPRLFEDMRAETRDRAEAAGKRFASIGLEHSFRSTAPVLEAVDAVFAGGAARQGLGADDRPIHHETVRAGQAGSVAVWPTTPAAPAAPAEPWAPEETPEDGASGEARLARLVAVTIKEWIGKKDLPARGRKLRAGDVMVLVRRRTAFVHALVRALKSVGVGVAGADRMVVTGELAVMDLMAIGRFLCQPDDDLSLACVLKGPFAELGEDDLYALAHGRDGSLWQALCARADETDGWRRARDLLGDLLARADFERPFELFSGILDRDDGRARLIARLGEQAEDPVDEFLELALAFERTAAPSLQGFLAWVESGQSQIKRDLEQAQPDQLRIMTVHGAKGLQAPVVILADTTANPRPPKAPHWVPGDGDPGPALPLWAPVTGDYDPVLGAAHDDATVAQAEEQHRLLYVAMTRAEDELYVCGWEGARAPPEGCWYKLVRDGLERIAEEKAFDFSHLSQDLSGKGLIHARPQDPAVKPSERREQAVAAPPEVPLEGWEDRPPPPEPTPSRPLAPSAAADEPAVIAPLAGDGGRRFLKGILVHGLLQFLPGLAPERRAEAARRYLARAALGLEEGERAAIEAETLALLDDPAFAELFGPSSLAEVPITGAVDGAVISGQIDRLVVTADRVLVVDYKTARPVPDDAARVAPAYLRQMALYRAALARVFPGREVACALLYTAGPKLLALPEAVLAAATAE